MTAPLVLFDWDSTLVDNWQAIHAAINMTRKDHGLPDRPLMETLGDATRGADKYIFSNMFGDEAEAARQRFYGHLESIHLEHLTVLDGAAEILDTLEARGSRMALASNKKGPLLRQEVEHLGWTARFEAIVGLDDTPYAKPAPEVLYHVLEAIAPAPRMLYVGDTDSDRQCATAAGLPFVFLKTNPAVANKDEIAAQSTYAFKNCRDFLQGMDKLPELS